MPVFTIGLALIYAAACVVALVSDQAVRPDNPWVLTLLLVVWAVPVGAGWAAAEIVKIVRGRRLRVFHAAHSWWLSRLVRGMAAGLLGVASSLAAFTFIDRPLGDAVVMGGCSAISVAAMLIAGRRIPAWACAGCGYDLRGLTSAAEGRCPECGLALAAHPARAGTIDHAALALARPTHG